MVQTFWQYLDLLIPVQLKGDFDQLIKIRFFIFVAIVSFLIGFSAIILSWFGSLQLHPFVGLEIINPLMSIIILWLFKNFTLTINTYIGWISVQNTISVLMTGGISSHIVIWLTIFPIFVLFFTGFRWACFWTCIQMVVLIVIFGLGELGSFDFNSTSEPVSNFGLLFNYLVFLVFMLFSVFFFSKSQNRLRQKLEEKQIALEDKNKELENKTKALNLAQNSLLNTNKTLEKQNNKLNKTRAKLMKSNKDLESQNEQLNFTRKALLESNLALERYAHTVSHDLKEPLRSIASFTQLLKSHYESQSQIDERGKEYFDFIQNGADNMNQLIKEMLQFSELSNQGKGDFKIVNLNQVIQIVKNNLDTQIKESEVEIVSDNLPKVAGLFIPIVQLFQNIISNAIKFRKSEGAAKILISSRESDNEYSISIADNGIGIKKEDSEKIFAEFGKIHQSSKYEGQGIGLATCKKIIQQHEGNIWLESTFGNGTTFHFTFPKVLNTSPRTSPNEKKSEMVTSQ